MQPKQPRQDDTDDIMAAILGGQTGSAQSQPRPVSASKAPKSPETSGRPKTVSKKARGKKEASGPSAGLIVSILFVVTVLLIAGAAITQRERIADFLAPPSPFTAEVKDSLEFPVYYPTKLPESFKLQTGTITQPESGVLIYRLTNDEDIAITISQQSPSDKINIDDLYESATGVEKYENSTGAVWIGTMSDGTLIANLVAPDTWLIATTTSGVVSTEEMKQVIGSLRQG